MQKCRQRWWSRGLSACNSCSWYLFTRRHLHRMRQILDWGICDSQLKQCVDFWGHLTNVSHTLDSLNQPVRFAVHMQPLCWNFLYHSLIVLSLGGSVWYMVWNLHCTITNDFVLAKLSYSPSTPCFVTSAPSGETVKYTMAPSTQKTWRDSLPIYMLLSAISDLDVRQPSMELPEELMNFPVLQPY
jgi:hypothetical protein